MLRGQAQAPDLVVRQSVVLLVLPGLDAVLGETQETVGIQQFGNRVVRQDLAFAEQAQHLLDRPDLQLAVASAAHQLKGLADELDLADTALAELDVRVHALLVQLTLDHALHVADRLDHAEIDVAAIHEGTQHRRQAGDLIAHRR